MCQEGSKTFDSCFTRKSSFSFYGVAFQLAWEVAYVVVFPFQIVSLSRRLDLIFCNSLEFYCAISKALGKQQRYVKRCLRSPDPLLW